MLTFDTAIGTCGVRWDDAGITRVHLPRERELTRPPGGFSDPGAAGDGVPDEIADAVAAISALLAGERRDLADVALSDASLDPFAREVYGATRRVGPGAVTKYGALARAIGRPDAAQAVGAALGANPFPIVVPCHRVLAADGSLHGFSAPGGIATKRRMLEIEGAPGFTQVALFA